MVICRQLHATNASKREKTPWCAVGPPANDLAVFFYKAARSLRPFRQRTT